MCLKQFLTIAFLGIGLFCFGFIEEHGQKDRDADAHRNKPSATKPAAGHDEHHDEVILTEAAIKHHGIRVGVANLQPLAPTFIAPARVAFNADAMAHVGSGVKGRIAELKIRIGDTVKKDDELAVVESAELGAAQSDFLQKRTAVRIAAAAIDPARDAHQRARALYEKSQGIALAEVLKREAEYRALIGAAETAKAAAAASENSLRLLGMSQTQIEQLAKSSEINPRFTIKAPIAGTVIEREVTLGELVSPEKEHLLILADISNYWVLVDVPEARLADIAAGSRVRVEVAAVRDEMFEGKVTLIGASVDPRTRTAQVRVEVGNGHTALRPGMFARAVVSIGKDKEPPVLAVPEQAVQTVEGSTSVFVPVEGEANTFAPHPVKVGKAVGGFLPVLDGLKAGDKLVIAGSFILKAELQKNEASHEH